MDDEPLLVRRRRRRFSAHRRILSTTRASTMSTPPRKKATTTVTAITTTVELINSCRLGQVDRKSTRLNSSHLGISYAVFCLKKKMNTTELSPEERAFGDFRVGRFAWRFRKPQLLEKRVPMTGRLGIFELPDSLAYVDRGVT